MAKEELRSRATECRIPLGVVMTFEEVLEDPHLLARDFWQEPIGRKGLRMPDIPFRFDEIKRNPPSAVQLVDVDEVWNG